MLNTDHQQHIQKPILMTKKMKQHAREISSNKESAKAFLVRAGLIHKDGQTAKEYR